MCLNRLKKGEKGESNRGKHAGRVLFSQRSKEGIREAGGLEATCELLQAGNNKFTRRTKLDGSDIEEGRDVARFSRLFCC